MSPALSPDHPSLAEITTPALVVDEAALHANITQMADFARDAQIALRPHAKTHKSATIAKLQLQAGAIGIACATVAEAEMLRAGGIDDLLLTSPVADAAKTTRIAALNRVSTLAVVVDHPVQVDLLGAAIGADGRPLAVLIDIDLGQKRTGVVDIADAVTMAKTIRSQAKLNFRGLQGFGGHIQHLIDAQERRDAAAAAGEQLRAIVEALNSEGFACDIISGSGTGACAYDAQGPYTELQVGSYLFMDTDYRRLQTARSDRRDNQAVGDGLPYRPALFVLATVVSASRPGQVTVDAGVKALAFNGPVPDILLGMPAGSRYQFAGDEHGIIVLPDGAERPAPGTRVLIAATHCDPTVNLHATYVFLAQDGGMRLLPIEGRYE
jgi:D-serine deaminase-like pyridoxal phosphate-dependent protein